MADTDSETGTATTRRERAVRFVDGYIDKHRELFEKLARE
jgi:hypothetical protein